MPSKVRVAIYIVVNRTLGFSDRDHNSLPEPADSLFCPAPSSPAGSQIIYPDQARTDHLFNSHRRKCTMKDESFTVILINHTGKDKTVREVGFDYEALQR